jgi:hypothetical protein
MGGVGDLGDREDEGDGVVGVWSPNPISYVGGDGQGKDQ